MTKDNIVKNESYPPLMIVREALKVRYIASRMKTQKREASLYSQPQSGLIERRIHNKGGKGNEYNYHEF